MTFGESSGNVFADIGFANPEHDSSRPISLCRSAASSKVATSHRQKRAQLSALSSPRFGPDS
jgi:hypothetical protein